MAVYPALFSCSLSYLRSLLHAFSVSKLTTDVMRIKLLKSPELVTCFFQVYLIGFFNRVRVLRAKRFPFSFVFPYYDPIKGHRTVPRRTAPLRIRSLARTFSRSLAPLTRLLALQCLLCSHAPLRSLTQSRAHGTVSASKFHDKAALNPSTVRANKKAGEQASTSTLYI